MPTPSAPSDPKADAPIAPPFDESLRQAWARYGNLIYAVCGLIIAGILAKGGWDYLLAQKEVGIRRDFALCTTPESFRAFAANHPGHPLAGAAELRVADDAYASGHFADAVPGYEKAAGDLPAGPFQSRARLGQAMALALLGKTTEAETALRQIFGDAGQLKAVRCEAGYHLATLAAAAGRPAEVQSLAEQLMQLDSSSPFAQRAFALRAEMAEPAAPSPAVPSIALPARN
jgi:hypothetical protein